MFERNYSPPYEDDKLGTRPISIAVVGVGRFGSLHARRLLSHPSFDLRCVIDISTIARDGATFLGCEVLTSADLIPREIQAAVIATPPETHVPIAIALMNRDIDLLVEKPVAIDESGLNLLLKTQATTGRLLCVSHIERFNAAKFSIVDTVGACDIEFHRVASAKRPKSDIVLDLMVHDLDLAAHWLEVPPNDEMRVIDVCETSSGVRASIQMQDVTVGFTEDYDAVQSLFYVCMKPKLEACLAKMVRAESMLKKFPGEDAISRQYSAFHAALGGNLDTIANHAAGAAAVRRALTIMRYL